MTIWPQKVSPPLSSTLQERWGGLILKGHHRVDLKSISDKLTVNKPVFVCTLTFGFLKSCGG